MSLHDFNPEELASSFAKEAAEVVPKDFSAEQKQFVINILYNYCKMAGEEIKKQNSKLTVNQACIICQFIGEWTFHKSIDLIKSGVPREHWEIVLQKVAFAVFEVAQRTQMQNKPQEQAINEVEQRVVKTYKSAIEELAQSGRIAREKVGKILSQSNIDDLSNEIHDAHNLSKEDEAKIYKMASMAIVLKKFPESKVQNILKNLPENEANQIIGFMHMADLEKQLDQKRVKALIDDFKKHLPAFKDKGSSNIIQGKITAILQKHPKEKVLNVISKERDEIKNLFDNPRAAKQNLSPYIANVICKHVEEKLTR